MIRVKAIPTVNPTTTCSGINLIIFPQRVAPMNINIIPASMVASCSPSGPNCAETESNNPMNAPVGPVICIRVPPNIDTQNTAIIEVYNPISGLTLDAIANAMDNGIVMIPTTIPANTFGKILFLLNKPARAASIKAIINLFKNSFGTKLYSSQSIFRY